MPKRLLEQIIALEEMIRKLREEFELSESSDEEIAELECRPSSEANALERRLFHHPTTAKSRQADEE
jgi:hypothetical protein